MSSYDITNWYWTVNDQSPAATVFKSATGGFVANNDAGYLAFLATPITSPEERSIQAIIAVSNNGSGNARLSISTTPSAPFAFTVGAVIQIFGTGTYDGPQAIAAIGANTIDIGVAFVGTATGSIVYAPIIDMLANLQNNIIAPFNNENWAAIPTFNQITANSNTTLTVAQLAKLIILTNTSGGNITVTLPTVMLPGSIPLGTRITILNASAGFANEIDILSASSATLANLASAGVNSGMWCELAPRAYDDGHWNNFAFPLTLFNNTPGAGELFIGQTAISGANFALFATMSGDATIDATGRVTVSSVEGGAAWTAWTPSISPNSGAVTTTVNRATYLKLGKMVLFDFNISLTVTSGSPTSVTMNLPFSTVNLNRQLVATGQEHASTLKMLQFTAAGGASQTDNILNYDGTNPLISGAQYIGAGMYEAA